MNRCSGSGSLGETGELAATPSVHPTSSSSRAGSSARSCAIIAFRHRQDLAEGLIFSALAELRRDDLVDDAVVEGVARDADAGMAERARADPAARRSRTARWRSRWCRRRSRRPARRHPGAAAGRRRRPRRPARRHRPRRAARAARTPPDSVQWRAPRRDCRRRNAPAARPRSVSRRRPATRRHCATSVRRNAASRSSNPKRLRKMRVSLNERLAAKVLNDWMKRCVPVPSRNCSIAHGPLSTRDCSAPSRRSSQNRSADM